ncbi:hypothetical protein [Thalassotalea fusca]
MSYTHNGQQIRIVPPVHLISVNKKHVVVNHDSGLSQFTFTTPADVKSFLTWLRRSTT